MAKRAELAEGESLTYEPLKTPSNPPDLRFIHYNDVYHVEAGSRDPVGGIARFKTLCDYYQSASRFTHQPDCLTLFSGDAFNPSLESTVTKGKHMVPALNAINTSVACLGNHDLDFGVEQFQYLASLCSFPWLCANVLDPALGDGVPLGRCQRSVMLTASNGTRVGVLGLVEREWLETINTLPPNLTFVEPATVAKELAAKLRSERADMVIALTHQREPNDNRLAEDLAPGTVDLILSGHDHFYAHSIVNGTHVLRSGTDFRQLSYLECWQSDSSSRNAGSKWTFCITRRDVVSSITPDQHAAEMVEQITASLAPKLEKPIGYTAAPLDARFTTVRLKESNLGNFVCDLMRFHYNADCCIMAAGTIRGDQVYPPGMLKVKDIMNCFPFEDPCVVVAVSGKAVVEALENGVSKYPALEGRFPQVSGISFAVDPAKPPGKRCFNIKIGEKPADSEQEYTLVTRDYMVRGKDGFYSLMLEQEGGTARSVVGDEEGMLISAILRQYFMSLKVLGRWKNWNAHMGAHWSSVHDGLHDLHPVREPVKVGEEAKLLMQQHDAGSDTPSLVGRAQSEHWHNDTRQRKHALGESHMVQSDSEDDQSHRADLPPVGARNTEHERQLILVRRVIRKWWRLAGLRGHPAMAEEQGEEFGVHWTRGICPRGEGRIRIAGQDTG